MVNNSTTTYSEDIRFFRETLNRALSPKLLALGKEINRLNDLPQLCEEEVLKKLYGKKHYKDPGFWQYARVVGWNLIEIIGKFGQIKDNPGSATQPTSFERFVDNKEKRKDEFTHFISELSVFYKAIQECYLLDATLKYAEAKKFFAKVDLDLLEQKEVGALTPEEIAFFLNGVMDTDNYLGNRIVDSLTSKFDTPHLRYTLLDNDLNATVEIISEKSEDFTRVVTPIYKGLHKLYILSCIDKCVEASRKIKKDYYLQYSASTNLPHELSDIFPSDEDGKPYLDCLTERLNAKKDVFTEDEFHAICGESFVVAVEEDKPTPQEDNDSSLDRLDDCFPGILPKFKTNEVIDIITECIAGHYIDDDPDMKALFKYRISGIGNLPQELLSKKVVWYMKGKHPNDLNGLLYTISKDRRLYQEYIARFFSFASGKDWEGSPKLISIAIFPITQHKNTKIVDELREYPELRHLF